MYKIGMISLGCPKNQVDAEIMLAKLAEAGFLISDEISGCDAVIVNTCAFIDDAKREAIENILDVIGYKNDGEIKKIIVTGCLSERYREEVKKEFPEVDTVIGIGANGDIADIVLKTIEGDGSESFPPKDKLPLCGARVLTTPEYWAYLKIAEGCSNSCTYCAIPEIRGPQRSRDIDDIIDEARDLAASGVKELILVAQDTTRYGEDNYKSLKLSVLLEQLCKIDGIEWIRLLYCYPERITDDLIETIANNDKIVNYLDIPLQHASKSVLKAMKRTGDYNSLKALIEKLRLKIPGLVIRTTLMTGFPGETEDDFEQLQRFVKEMKFERLGCFAFSPEEGTVAAALENQLPDEEKKHRGELIMDTQYGILISNNEKQIGKTLKVLCEGYDAYNDIYEGRSYMDAPEIDGKVYFTCKDELSPGDFTDVLITGYMDYDLQGEA